MPEPGLPAFRSVPSYPRTDGDLAAKLGEHLGMIPDANQRDILDAIFAENAVGEPSFFEVGIVAPRQNLKTAALQLAAMTYLFVLDEELVIWTAHLFKTTQKAFLGMRNLISRNPYYKAKCKWPPPASHGWEAIELKSGQRIEFHARSKGSGRGFTGSKIILDEALFLGEGDLGSLVPTLATVDSAQVLYASSAGLVTSEALRDVRDRGRKRSDPELAYWEWCAPPTDCADERCPHVVGTAGCALDREDLWETANPALDLRITRRRIQQFRRMMPPGEFRREFLGWWDDPVTEAGFPMETWDGCKDRTSAPRGLLVLAVDVSPDSRSAAVVAAIERTDGKTHLEVIEHRPRTDWLAARCSELTATHRPAAWFLDPNGPAKAAIPELVKVKIEPRHVDIGQACEGFVAAVKDGKLVHLGDGVLARAIEGAGRRDIGDGLWAWSRKRSDVDIAPLVAATGAHWGLATVERPKPQYGPPLMESLSGDGLDNTDLMNVGF